MSDFDYMASMAAIQRESRTEAKVRGLDADDIVKWVHELEDQIERNEEQAEESAEKYEAISAKLDKAVEALVKSHDCLLASQHFFEGVQLLESNLNHIKETRDIARQALQEVADGD